MEAEKNEIKQIPSLLSAVRQIDVDGPLPEKHYWNFCVNCGTPLDGRKCKLFCPTCGFYHNCSEP